ncbi:ACT domain-containing protein [uncultured Tateyamaria sp.]|uniref:ACT domain-containing protein n=1 Tax=uncultured Tateyamaria sp. TaxID=455651 RepID=UPI00262F42C4|nr:ACT domain-containing protein [uncultured Tateyamaria sp.]
MTVKDTAAMIAGIQPVLNPGAWSFCAVTGGGTFPPDVFVAIQASEGTPLILSQASAALKMIKLQVQSDFEGVGLPAAVATTLSRQSIPCNVVAGDPHDHIFVSEDQASLAHDTLLKR